MSIDLTALPSELLVAPQPLIGFCGLDVSKNAMHKSIWDAFTTNRKPDRAAVQFKLLPTNYEYPVAKPKRASYEWYHPKGILKRNWMLKHLHVLPAVIVLFQDMEWNDAQWSEKQVQCASMVQSLKNSLQERNTRLCLVLLQKSAPLPPGEDMLASERAASLTTACGLNSKMLFILPHTDHLIGYTLRLESAFVDMAQAYYALMAKRVRTHRDQLTAAHITLKIRHQFKLGFIAEMRQDFSTALKHYTQAYASLEEIRATDSNCLEMKTIAGFLNYKICRLMFKLNVPRDAINHFINHVDKYKNRVGFKDLIFEHYAWLSTQHSVFAELFCEAIKNGLPALQTQHPGIYFHKAAEYIIKRREAFLQCSAVVLSPTEPTSPTTLQSNNTNALYTEFFAIRAVKSGEPLSEQQANSLITENEKSFNHSNAIINLLSQAMAQFKIYKCLRFRKKLAIDMAEEYFRSGDHAKALTLYSLMLPDYREDNWPSLSSDVLQKTLRCALLSASVTDFLTCSIEALSLNNKVDKPARINILENMFKVFQGVPPVSPTQFAPELFELWENTLVSVKSPICVDLDKISKLFNTIVTFEKPELKNDETIKIYLILKLFTDVPLKTYTISIVLTDGLNNFKLPGSKYTSFSNLTEMRVSHQNTNTTQAQYQHFDKDTKLEPDIYYEFYFTAEAKQFLENTQLRVSHIEIHLGCAKLSALLTKSGAFTRNPFRHHNRNINVDDNLTINTMCYIVPTFHLNTQTTFGHETMLVNEYNSVMTTINNPFNIFLQNVVLSISVPNHLRNKVFLTTDVSPSRQKLHSHIQIDIGELSMQASNTVSYFIFSIVETTIVIIQKICYTMNVTLPKSPTVIQPADVLTPNSPDNSPNNVRTTSSVLNPASAIISPVQIEIIDESLMRKIREDTLSIKCDFEFKFAAQFYTLSRKPLTKIYRGENFLLRANIEVQSEKDIEILETFFICDHNLVQSTYSFKRKKFTNTYSRGDELEDVIVMRSNSTLEEWITLKDFEQAKLHGKADLLEEIRKSRELNFLDNSVTKQETATNANKSNMNLNLFAQSLLEARSNSIKTATSNLLSSMSSSLTSDDGKAIVAEEIEKASDVASSQNSKVVQTRIVYNKAMDAVVPTGHCRGFIKPVLTADQQQSNQQPQPVFGIYCIKWRRQDSKEENESKFVINGMDIESPPLNLYCTIEEKIFVKIPVTFKIVLKNPTSKIIHLVANLNTTDSVCFVCSGHKQIDISIFAYGEQELVYNLYPLYVGWQNLPELTLEYNTQADLTKDEAQNTLLNELAQRSMPKQVLVLPPLKQQIK